MIKHIAKAERDGREFPEIELTDKEMVQRSRGLDSSTVVFSKPIPFKVLLSPERMDAILSSTKANLLLTQRQAEPLRADPPLLIHGQAGSGKTTLLCHRLAASILRRRNQPQARFVFLSYNDKLVKQALADTQEILRDVYDASGSFERACVEFVPFQDFLKRYVPNPSRFEKDNYVPFGRFKEQYGIFKRGNPAAKRISAELAWHGIRSILKGACVPPSRPPLSHEAYKGLAKKRRDFPQDMFDDIYRIGEWYQREVIQDKKLWDDQDLAWTALSWVVSEKERNPEMLLYDEILCDEGQDLTEIEFRLLIALCKQPMAGGQEGLQLVFAGDPLQTINPTGFRWSIIRSEVYRVQDRPVSLHELQENFRSDKRIVAFANRIQLIRSRYMGQHLPDQEAFEKDGDTPLVVIADTEDEISIIRDKLSELLPESAVIVWPEETDEVAQLCQKEKALSRVDRQLDLYSISEAKGLEFRLVVLYKFGSSSEVLKWKGYFEEKRELPVEDEIPLLYFLNRLYVAVTRAKSFLLVVDTKSGYDNFWSIWKDRLYSVPRSDVEKFLSGHPAFKGEVSDAAWRQWAETLFEYAERTSDLRLYERARRAYEKANEMQSVNRIDARLMEIAEHWEKAAKLYFDINEFALARNCYERAEMWEDAYKACSMLPTTPESKRRMAIYRFKIGIKQDTRKAAAEFFDYASKDDGLDRRYLDELGHILLRVSDHERAAQVFLRVARANFGDRTSLVQAARSFFEAGKSEEAEKLFAEAGETKGREYQLIRAENYMRKRDWREAAQLFFGNQAFEKVVAVYELAKQEKGMKPAGQLQEWVAASYLELQRYDDALAAYKSLLSELGKQDDIEILRRIAECLEKLGKKPDAYDYYCKAQSYDKAADLAQELGRPREEILLLKIEGARKDARFDDAIRFAEEKKDERLVREIKGHKHMYYKEFGKAVPEFVEAEEWTEALNALDDAIADAQHDKAIDNPEDFKRSQWGSILRAVAKSHKRPSRVESQRLMEIYDRLKVDPIWVNYVTPPDMGLVFEKCAKPMDAIRYYEDYILEPWAQEGRARVERARQKHARVTGFRESRRV
jgi:DNA helicase IV